MCDLVSAWGICLGYFFLALEFHYALTLGCMAVCGLTWAVDNRLERAARWWD